MTLQTLERRTLGLGLLLLAALGTPLLLGRGVDLPEDSLAYGASGWEWLQRSLMDGRAPWFVPGKLGGVSLFADGLPMGPFYPAVGLTLLLPVHIALPLACLLHAVGALLAVRWLARGLGASPLAATLAGASLGAGPVVATAFVAGRMDLWAGLLWFPVVLGCIVRAAGSDTPQQTLRLVAAAGLALALLLLGSPASLGVRALVGTALALALWRVPVRASLALMGLGLAAGLPGLLPSILEWREAAAAGASLSQGSSQALSALQLPGFLVPRAPLPGGDVSLGFLAGVAVILGISWQGPARRPALLGGALLLALLLGQLPGQELPGNDLYLTLALVPLAAVAALGLDHLLALDRPGAEQLLRSKRAAGLACLVLVAGLGATLGWGSSGHAARLVHGLGALQALLAAAALAFVLLRLPPGPRRSTILAAVVLLELGATGLRFHLLAPSSPLQLQQRAERESALSLASGWLDLAELEVLEISQDPSADPGTAARASQAAVLDRAQPLHAGLRWGYRGLAGRSRHPPARVLATLRPAAEALRAGPADRSTLLAPGGLLHRTASLHGVPLAVERDGTQWQLPDAAPACYSAQTSAVEPSEARRVERLLGASFDPDGTAWLEPPSTGGTYAEPEALHCEQGRLAVSTSGQSLVVLNQTFHRGWRALSAGRELQTLPVNQVHTGILVPPGQHDIELSFQPPGLCTSLLVAGLGWLGALLFLAGPGLHSRLRDLRAGAGGGDRWILLPAATAAAVASPLVLWPRLLLNADSYRAYDWLEATKYRWLAREAWLQEGRLALWSPWLEGGNPAFAHPGDSSASPSMLTTLLFGAGPGMKLDALLLLVAGATGIYALSRRWLRVDPLAAALAGTCFAVAGWLPSRLAVGFYESLWLCVVPWTAVLLLAASRAEGWRQAAPSLAAASLLLAAAGVQMQLCLAFSFLVLGLWAAAAALLGEPRERRLPACVGIAGLGVALLGAVKFLPMLELLQARGWRVIQSPRIVGNLDAIAGAAAGLFQTADAVGVYGADGQPLVWEYEYGGLPVLAGLAAALGLLAASRRARAPALLLLLCLALAWRPGQGYQVSLFELLRPLPVFESVRATARYIQFFALLWACILAGLGFERALAWARGGPSWRMRGLVGLTVAGLLVSAVPSSQLCMESFRHPSPAPGAPVDPFFQAALPDYPSTGSPEVALFTWLAPQVGAGVLYQAEDLRRSPPSQVEPAWRFELDGQRVPNPSYRGEARFVRGRGELGPLHVGVNRLRVAVRTEGAARLLLNQNADPGWQHAGDFEVFEEAGRIAVDIPSAYQGIVELKYRSRHLPLGLLISLTTLALCLLLLRRPEEGGTRAAFW